MGGEVAAQSSRFRLAACQGLVGGSTRRMGAAKRGLDLVDHPFGHSAIGGELAAGDGKHAARTIPKLVTP